MPRCQSKACEAADENEPRDQSGTERAAEQKGGEGEQKIFRN
jgi:hypothetical protein